MVSLVELNKGEDVDFIAALGDVFEHSPWLVARTASARPFASRDALIDSLMMAMREAAEEACLDTGAS